MYSKLESKVDFDFYDGSKIVLGNIHGMEVQSRPHYLILTTSLDRNSQLAPPPQNHGGNSDYIFLSASPNRLPPNRFFLIV